jgi:hypothetical protein
MTPMQIQVVLLPCGNICNGADDRRGSSHANRASRYSNALGRKPQIAKCAPNIFLGADRSPMKMERSFGELATEPWLAARMPMRAGRRLFTGYCEDFQ